jgi:hypothetical protein
MPSMTNTPPIAAKLHGSEAAVTKFALNHFRVNRPLVTSWLCAFSNSDFVMPFSEGRFPVRLGMRYTSAASPRRWPVPFTVYFVPEMVLPGLILLICWKITGSLHPQYIPFFRARVRLVTLERMGGNP